MIYFFQNKIIIRGCGAFVNKNVNKIDWQKFCCLHMMKKGCLWHEKTKVSGVFELCE